MDERGGGDRTLWTRHWIICRPQQQQLLYLYDYYAKMASEQLTDALTLDDQDHLHGHHKDGTHENVDKHHEETRKRF